MAEQRYEAVRAVIADGETVTEFAARFGVARKTVHAWLARYEAGGLDGLADRSHRPRSCPHQMTGAVEVALAGLRLAHPSWGPRRLVFELARSGVPAVSESAACRALARLNLIDPAARRPRDRKWKRWERAAPMELWQMDVVGGFGSGCAAAARHTTVLDSMTFRRMMRYRSAACDHGQDVPRGWLRRCRLAACCSDATPSCACWISCSTASTTGAARWG